MVERVGEGASCLFCQWRRSLALARQTREKPGRVSLSCHTVTDRRSLRRSVLQRSPYTHWRCTLPCPECSRQSLQTDMPPSSPASANSSSSIATSGPPPPTSARTSTSTQTISHAHTRTSNSSSSSGPPRSLSSVDSTVSLFLLLSNLLFSAVLKNHDSE